MSKIKQSPKLPPEERKKQLLNSAQKLFAQKGYRETSTNEIAQNAGLTKGALYFHFKNKEDILFELVKHVSEHCRCMVHDNISTLKSPADFLAIFMNPEKVGFGHDELTGNLDFWTQALAIPRIKRFLNKQFKELMNNFVESVDSAYGRTRKDREQLAVLTYALVDGLMVRQIMDPKIVDMPAQVKLFKKLCECTKIKK